MKDSIYFCMDLVSYSILGGLLAYLFKGFLPERFALKTLFGTSSFMCLQFMAVRMFLAYSAWAKQMMYGETMYMLNSRQSIFPAAVSMAVTLICGLILYQGSRMKLLSLATGFYAFLELARFTFYSMAVRSIGWCMEYINRLFLEEECIGFEKYQKLVESVETVWNVLMMALVIILLFFCIREYKKCLMSGGNTYHSQEAALLLIPEFLGLVIGIMLRCILFYYQSREMYSLIENYPELNVVIPCMSLLCMASILLSAKMLLKVADEHEKRCHDKITKERAAELEAHVRDMENVYMKIRGMKHDLKNYIADVNALLVQMEAGDDTAGAEVHHYVDSMQKSLEKLELAGQTQNVVTDVILERYMHLAKQKNIVFSSDFLYPKQLGIDVFDIGIILNNGLQNAIEACDRQNSGKAYIRLSAKCIGRMFLITIENSFQGTLRWSGQLLISEKSAEDHGLGLMNIRNCAEKYYGKMEIRAEENCFCLTVMLQGNPLDRDDKKDSDNW